MRKGVGRLLHLGLDLAVPRSSLCLQSSINKDTLNKLDNLCQKLISGTNHSLLIHLFRPCEGMCLWLPATTEKKSALIRGHDGNLCHLQHVSIKSLRFFITSAKEVFFSLQATKWISLKDGGWGTGQQITDFSLYGLK